MVYDPPVIRLFRTDAFHAWFGGLKDRMAMVRIAARIDRMASGNPGDVRAVGSGISEMRIHYGPGYRVYFKQQGLVIVLLCGGDKRSQVADIRRAIQIAANREESNHGSEETT
jgi:putative addiction module killer protein